MITISVLGLDQYTTGHYSKEHTKNLANLFETKEENILFYAPQCFILHNGVEQTSWNTIVRVHAPHQYEVFEAKIAKYLLETLKEFTINLEIEFYYYEKNHRYEYQNKEYPHFLTDENIVNVEESEDGDDDEEDSADIYEGNIFEQFQTDISKESADEEKNHHKH